MLSKKIIYKILLTDNAKKLEKQKFTVLQISGYVLEGMYLNTEPGEDRQSSHIAPVNWSSDPLSKIK